MLRNKATIIIEPIVPSRTSVLSDIFFPFIANSLSLKYMGKTVPPGHGRLCERNYR